MKIKTHSGAKKRIKVNGNGKVFVNKAAKRHLLANKSKRQKKSHKSGMAVTTARIDHIRKLLPGQVK
jgi:large subunit ribosomal protein L35